MRPIRRHDLSPRVELIPLIDVIFLLLTFFIYSLVLVVRAEILPVRLTPVGTGEKAKPAKVAAITIDREGRLYLDKQLVGAEQLNTRLTELAGQAEKPRLFVAMEEEGQTDRGPVLVDLIQRLRAAGLEDVSLVGPAAKSGEKAFTTEHTEGTE
ncbi:MAG: biopolymer transporter ExbD [Phycisphaeraceae bacterium]|nr:biopolymer transporter ExbD [Phycisphaeraceae bacterium]